MRRSLSKSSASADADAKRKNNKKTNAKVAQVAIPESAGIGSWESKDEV